LLGAPIIDPENLHLQKISTFPLTKQTEKEMARKRRKEERGNGVSGGPKRRRVSDAQDTNLEVLPAKRLTVDSELFSQVQNI